MRKRGPVDAVVALTYRCNLRCVTCDLGDRHGGRELEPDVLRRLPRSLRYVNLTGGEPFLREDVEECILAVAAATGAEITVSTNGTLPERAASVVKALAARVPRLGVSVSVDGLEETHDRIRQAPGSFRKAMGTARALKSVLGKRVHLAFTVSAGNAGEFESVAALAQQEGYLLSLAFTHSSEHYFKPREGATPSREGVLAASAAATAFYLKTFSPAAAARAFFAAGFERIAVSGRRPLPCRAGDRFIYVDPTASVYLCNMRAEPMGNLGQDDFQTIWTGATRAALLPTTGVACPVQCWMVCTARTSIRDNAGRVAAWAAAAYARRLAAG